MADKVKKAAGSAVSKAHKEGNLKWDRENMRSLTCRVRSYEADIFKEYCDFQNTTPGKILKEYVMQCIKEYNKINGNSEDDKVD